MTVILGTVDKKWCRFIIDIQSSVSLIKEGISRYATQKTTVSSHGVIGSSLNIKGIQNIKVYFGSLKLDTHFLLCHEMTDFPIYTMYRDMLEDII